MTAIASPMFSQQVFATPGRRQNDKNSAVQGFSQIFASMLSAELRRGALGSDTGMMGTAGGATGDIYGAFFDQAIAKVLSRSPAMKPLNEMVSRQLGGTAGRGTAKALSAAEGRLLPAEAGKALARPVSYTTAAPANASESALSTGSGDGTASDGRGPLLLPPRPAMFAPVLPPPTTLTEG